MHHLIKSMRTCLREAIPNDGGFIYYLQFLLLYCLMPVFCIKLLGFFLYFVISSSFHFSFLLFEFITNNNHKKFNTFNILSQFPRLYQLKARIINNLKNFLLISTGIARSRYTLMLASLCK